MKVLNLYAGLGGNRKLWVDCEVTAVEKDSKIAAVYQRLNPKDQVIIGDAKKYLLDHFSEFDFIWSSPPCQSHSKMIRSGRNRKPRYPDMGIYEEILFLKHNFNGDWVVENVKPYYEPFLNPKAIGRHLIWSNFSVADFEAPEFKNFINRQNLSAKKDLQDWLGIHYNENIYYESNHCPTQILRNCVHPDMGLHIFNQSKKQKQNNLNFSNEVA
jgi:DNA (cytosine-5)-methyltransferase 1